LDVAVAGTSRQFGLQAVVLLAAYGDEHHDVVGVEFGEMAHENVTVSDVVDVAVMV
jgi:hypothetical protein